MSNYKISPYSYKMAKELGVDIKPSLNTKKKIDVFKDNKKIVSIGANGMMDYPNYLKYKGKTIADERRRLYKKRHEKTRHVKGSASYYADKILW
jgi:hypothetical protein